MKAKYPLKKGQIEEGIFEDNLGVPSIDGSTLISDTEGNKSWVPINKFAGPLTGQIDVAGINVFYADYNSGPVVDFSLSPTKILGTKVYSRVRGGLVGTFPGTWNLSGDAISVDDTKFNELTILYVSDLDVRVENRIVPFVETNTSFTATYTIPTDNYEFQLPVSQDVLLYGTGEYQNNFIVDWGDGNETTVINGLDFDTLRTHTYATAGNYTQTIKGTCEYFSWYWSDSANTMTSIDAWGIVGFKLLNFAGAANLASLPSEVPDFSALENIDAGEGVALFEDCPNITILPAGIFDNAPVLRSVSSLFNNYSSISTFTGPLFPNSPLIDNVDNMFYESIIDIATINPTDIGFFPNVTAMQYTFASTANTALPPDLMDIFPNLITGNGVFWNCSGLTSIPSTFLMNTNLTSIETMFQNCSGLTAIPADFFDGIPNVDNIYMLFRDCTSLSGPAPEIWLRDPALTTTRYAFQNCLGLSNYASIPATYL